MAINIITAATSAAKEGGTFGITVSFEDEDGNSLTPQTINWDLTDDDGEIVNSRSDVSVAVPAASITIVLSGDDLVADEEDGDYTHLGLVVKGTYNSALGSDLPFQDQVRFSVEPIKGS